MEVILSQDVKSIGKTGEVIKVKDGFARNYLLPNKLAYLATPSNLKRIELQEKQRNAQSQQMRQEAEALAEKLNKVSCTVNVEVNDRDKLYGSVVDADIVRALEVEGFSIDKRNVLIEQPIEELGIFEVGVKLHPDVIAKVR